MLHTNDYGLFLRHSSKSVSITEKCISRADFFYLLPNCFGFNAESVFRQTCIGLLRMNRCSKLKTRNFSEMLRKVDVSLSVSVNNQQPCNTLPLLKLKIWEKVCINAPHSRAKTVIKIYSIYSLFTGTVSAVLRFLSSIKVCSRAPKRPTTVQSLKSLDC